MFSVASDIMKVDATQTKEIKLSGASPYNNAIVRVRDSTDVHFGTKIHYKGPVTLERLLYPKTKVDFHALESKLWLNDSTGKKVLISMLSSKKW